jgi:hypothetical protein
LAGARVRVRVRVKMEYRAVVRGRDRVTFRAGAKVSVWFGVRLLVNIVVALGLGLALGIWARLG